MTRKIDALVAEKVMGLETRFIDGAWLTTGVNMKEITEATPLYSSTWAGMGEVVEKMEAEGWYWTSRKAPDNCYFLQFVKNGKRRRGNGWSETAFTEAVCIAALRAKGVPEEEIQAALNG